MVANATKEEAAEDNEAAGTEAAEVDAVAEEAASLQIPDSREASPV